MKSIAQVVNVPTEERVEWHAMKAHPDDTK
jgi:hypothetical protein